MNIADLRKEYTQAELDISNVDTSPYRQFDVWFKEALKSELLEPNAMVLSTADSSGKPLQRTVLLKAFDEKGFVFYTNYESRKAKQIAENNQVCLLFPWYGLERQVIITGKTEKVSKLESLEYFMTRPHGSQLGAWVSNQSSVITSRSILEIKFNEVKQKFKDGKVPLPNFWGGFRVIPDSIEFWQGRSNRLHDRIYYLLENEAWNISRLSP
jgi:pyridoxamine 5'-phosphate oxidase